MIYYFLLVAIFYALDKTERTTVLNVPGVMVYVKMKGYAPV
jgi:hypothetical protein